jgi:hypothetical protein
MLKSFLGIFLIQQHQQSEMATLSNDINAARSRLVQSPDRLRRTISELSRNTNSEKALLSSFQTKARDLGMKLDQIGALEQVGLTLQSRCERRGTHPGS